MMAAINGVYLRHQSAQSHPEADPTAFEIWRQTNSQSMRAFLVAFWGTLIIQMSITFLNLTSAEYSDLIGSTGGVLSMFTLFFGLLIAGFMNVKAARIKWEAGIRA